MIPKIFCRDCSSELTAGDKFCSTCGAHIDWDALNAAVVFPELSARTQMTATTLRCPLCGQENAVENVSCGSCGNLLKDGTVQKPRETAIPGKPSKSSLLQSLQSWKLTAALALVLITVILFFQLSNKNDSVLYPAVQPPVNSQILLEIQSLEQAVTNNPNDKATLLRLANLLHDVNFHAKAIERYQQYLQLDPENVEARVDLGVTYFNFALSDSIHYLQFLNKARREMETAISLSPNYQLGLFNLGIVNLHLGDMRQATEWFQKCAKVDSTTETGRKALILINQHLFTNSS